MCACWLGCGRKAALPNLEEALLQWITGQWNIGFRVSYSILKKKALELFSSGQVDNESGPETFTASIGWMQGFMRRKGIR